ncbi:Protein FAF-like chloroplastic [Quillaja saponaria]|uniref:Protein FAF-like chloroplastic n=1 Tax=Quillaja saponaria TaxID=32244 RepID=A0AAD7QGW8_QUISA|nr:Protein FAF-like chloroplastic [Quillaja saponaria]
MSTRKTSSGFYSSLKFDEESKLIQKQGIVTILGSDSDRGRAASLRRTLSADMSSKKWLSQNGIYPMKKIASSDELSLPTITADSSSPSTEGEEEDYQQGQGEFDVWSSIQQEKNERKEEGDEKPGQFDIWSSIIAQKANDDTSKSLPPPYVHPLVKRSQSSLTEKSLEICTESLGSETGSDVFSSYPPSETGDGDTEEDKEEEAEQQETERVTLYDAEEEIPVAKYNSAAAASSKKLLTRSFPPPIPSLSRQDGALLHMRSHRDNGRLVLEAVSIPSKNNFLAQRQDGRLVLTFVNDPDSEGELKNAGEEEIHEEEYDEQVEDNMEEFEEVFGEFEEDDNKEEDDETEEDIEIVMEQEPNLSGGITNFHRLAIMMNKPIGLTNRNPSWSEKFNKVVNFEEGGDEVEEPTAVAKSLPPRPRVTQLIPSSPSMASAAAAASFNAYEYYWRTKPTEIPTSVLNQLANQQNLSLNNNSSKLIFSKNFQMPNNQQQQLLVLRENKGDCLVPMLNTCKESRISFLFRERYCIATS